MTVGVVAGDPALQPMNLGHAEVLAEDPRVILLGEPRISLLHFAEETFFGGEQCAAPVDIDAAALQHDSPAVVFRLPDAALQLLIYFRDSDGIFLVIGVFRPDIEDEM